MPVRLSPGSRNLLHSALLIAAMASLAGFSAWVFWGLEGVLWAFAGVLATMALTPTVPPAFVLSLYRAERLARADLPEVYAVLDELARRADLERSPELYYLPSTMLNAFAVGSRRSAVIAVTDGMLRSLTLQEMAGVLAHEMAHVANNDLRIMTLADAMSRLTMLMAYLGIALLLVNLPAIAVGAVVVPWLAIVALLLAPTASSLLQLALSRAREFDADLEAARLLGDPQALALALAKLERRESRMWETLLLPGSRVPDPSILRSHPSAVERIERLKELGPGDLPLPPVLPRHPAAIPSGLGPVARPPGWRWWGIWY